LRAAFTAQLQEQIGERFFISEPETRFLAYSMLAQPVMEKSLFFALIKCLREEDGNLSQ